MVTCRFRSKIRLIHGKREKSREGPYTFGDFYCLDWALYLAGPAEDAIPLSHRVSLPSVEEWFSAIVWRLLLHSLLLTWYVHLVEYVDWANRDANSVGDTNVEVYCNGDTVYAKLLADALLLPDLMTFMVTSLGPFIREGGVVNNSSL